MSEEKRQINSFGPNFIIESGSEKMGTDGKTSYQMVAMNDDGVKYHQGLYGNGKHVMGSTGPMEITCSTNAEVTKTVGHGLMVHTHNGDLTLSAPSGTINITAPNIVIEAQKSLNLHGNRIQVGHEDATTEEIVMNATKIDVGEPTSGNIAELLQTHNLFKAFTGSYCYDRVAGELSSAAGGLLG